MDWDAGFVQRMERQLRLAVDPRHRRHGAGNQMGHGPGASLEFHDHRAYVAGDDPRHIDWRVLARTEQYVIRRYRQEVSPRVEVLLDTSASMAIAPAKARLAATLALLLVQLARAAGARPAVWVLGGSAERIDRGGLDARLAAVQPGGSAGLAAWPVPDLAAGADRYLIGDGLIPSGGRRVVERLGRGAGRLCLVQVLTATERDPEPLGGVRLVDVEGGVRDLVHDAECCAAYRQRLARLQGDWQAALNGRGAGLVSCAVEAGPEAAVQQLLRHGVLEVAA